MFVAVFVAVFVPKLFRYHEVGTNNVRIRAGAGAAEGSAGSRDGRGASRGHRRRAASGAMMRFVEVVKHYPGQQQVNLLLYNL